MSVYLPRHEISSLVKNLPSLKALKLSLMKSIRNTLNCILSKKIIHLKTELDLPLTDDECERDVDSIVGLIDRNQEIVRHLAIKDHMIIEQSINTIVSKKKIDLIFLVLIF